MLLHAALARLAGMIAARHFATLALRLLTAAACVALPAPGSAQGTGGVAVIRDAETEQLLRDYLNPIFRAAGVNGKATRIILIGDRGYNAFVADGQKIFINVGALMDSKTPNEIIGVLAHETGHIAGGHLSRMRAELARAQIWSVIGMLASAGAVAGSTLTRRGNGNGPIGMDQGGMAGVMLGPQELVRRSLLAYQRTEEAAADRAAVKYLDATGQSAKGMLTTFERFANDALFRSSDMDPYLVSHPLPVERISNLQPAAHSSGYFERADPPALQVRHDMMRAKLFGFIGTQSEIARRYPVSDTSLPARYATAISNYRFGRLNEALSQIDGLLAAQPGNAYFHELKGQVLLESGRGDAAIAPLRKASGMSAQAWPIRVMLGHALVSSNAASANAEAIRILEQATQADPDSAEGFEYLAMAYDRKGDTPKAQLAAAQGMFVSGRYVEARTQAQRAQNQFKEGSPGWLKADDILNYRPPVLD